MTLIPLFLLWAAGHVGEQKSVALSAFEMRTLRQKSKLLEEQEAEMEAAREAVLRQQSLSRRTLMGTTGSQPVLSGLTAQEAQAQRRKSRSRQATCLASFQ